MCILNTGLCQGGSYAMPAVGTQITCTLAVSHNPGSKWRVFIETTIAGRSKIDVTTATGWFVAFGE